jgi:fructosamine-3-kinase
MDLSDIGYEELDRMQLALQTVQWRNMWTQIIKKERKELPHQLNKCHIKKYIFSKINSIVESV